jgi:hypothetical protein
MAISGDAFVDVIPPLARDAETAVSENVQVIHKQMGSQLAGSYTLHACSLPHSAFKFRTLGLAVLIGTCTTTTRRGQFVRSLVTMLHAPLPCAGSYSAKRDPLCGYVSAYLAWFPIGTVDTHCTGLGHTAKDVIETPQSVKQSFNCEAKKIANSLPGCHIHKITSHVRDMFKQVKVCNSNLEEVTEVPALKCQGPKAVAISSQVVAGILSRRLKGMRAAIGQLPPYNK